MAVEHINDTEIAMGKVVSKLPSNAIIASYDIGGIGYFADRHIVDLGGLVNPAVVPALKEGRAAELLVKLKISHVVIPMGGRANAFKFPDFVGFRRGVYKGYSCLTSKQAFFCVLRTSVLVAGMIL